MSVLIYELALPRNNLKLCLKVTTTDNPQDSDIHLCAGMEAKMLNFFGEGETAFFYLWAIISISK